MDYFNRFTDATKARSFNVDSLLKFTDLAAPVQRHLQRVYTTLAAAIAVASAGVWTNIALHGLLGGWLAFFGSVACLFCLTSTPAVPKNLNKRYGYLAGTAFCQGLTLVPLVNLALDVHPGGGLLLTAFAGCSVAFACFSGAAALSRRRSYLFLAGGLSSAMSLMLVMRLGSLFFGRGVAAFNVELYGGLLVFLGYILVDTQMIIERAYAADYDHIKHALDLFVDFTAIFVRVLVILLRNAESRDERRSRKRRS